MSSDSPQKQVFRVNIFNQALSISSSSSPEDFQRIADQVDLLMGMIASKSGTSDGVRVGVLAAMHLADRLHQAQRELAAAGAQAAAMADRASATETGLSGAHTELEHSRALFTSLQCRYQEAEQTIQDLKEQLIQREEAYSALQAELASAKGSLAAAQAEIVSERSRIGRDAGRLHHMLEQALDASPTAPVALKPGDAAGAMRAPETQDLFSFDDPASESEGLG